MAQELQSKGLVTDDIEAALKDVFGDEVRLDLDNLDEDRAEVTSETRFGQHAPLPIPPHTFHYCHPTRSSHPQSTGTTLRSCVHCLFIIAMGQPVHIVLALLLSWAYGNLKKSDPSSCSRKLFALWLSLIEASFEVTCDAVSSHEYYIPDIDKSFVVR
jgi:hypothetical protein